MLMTTVRLVAALEAVELPSSAIVDLLWLHVAPPDGVTHIHVRAGPVIIDVVFFTVASSQGIADQIARGVCARAAELVPALRHWTVL